MAQIFFPSCKAKAAYPAASARLLEYLTDRWGVTAAGCCRVDHPSLTAEDVAVAVCNNCAAILEESSSVGQIRFVWELIDSDPDFPFPDYGGETITVQDCWLAVDRRQVQETVRSLLRKMNLQLAEQPESYEKTRFCGVNLLSPCSESNARLAPRRYENGRSPMFRPMTPEQQAAFFRRHCAAIDTRRVACYCKFCTEGIRAGGKEGVHLLELLFPGESGE